MSNTRPRLGVISATVTVCAQPYSKGQRICRTSILSLIFFVSHIAVLMATTSSRVWDRRERGRNSPKSRPIKNLFRIIWLLIVGRCGWCGVQISELSFHHGWVSCRQTVVRNVANNHRASRNDAPLADSYARTYRYIAAQPRVVANGYGSCHFLWLAPFDVI